MWSTFRLIYADILWRGMMMRILDLHVLKWLTYYCEPGQCKSLMHYVTQWVAMECLYIIMIEGVIEFKDGLDYDLMMNCWFGND